VKLKYEPALDGLRATAVLAVIGFHLAKPIVTGGSLGVDVFFVLSGYLITSILAGEVEATGRIDYPAFLMRRARRLLPALLALLAAYWILCPLLWPALMAKRAIDVAAAALYVTNLRQTFWPTSTPLSPTWSLSIEEQFYLLWPWALIVLTRLRRGHAAIALAIAWAALTAARIFGAGGLPGPAPYYFTPFHATGLVLGAALALHPVTLKVGRFALFALVVLIFFGGTNKSFLFVQPIAEVLSLLVIADPPRFLAGAAPRFLGKISYGVYLWHTLVFWVAGAMWAPSGLGGIAALFAASIAAGAASYFAIERWFLRPSIGRQVAGPARI